MSSRLISSLLTSCSLVATYMGTEGAAKARCPPNVSRRGPVVQLAADSKRAGCSMTTTAKLAISRMRSYRFQSTQMIGIKRHFTLAQASLSSRACHLDS